MALKVVHDSVDEIEEPFRGLYSERDGKFVLTGIEGVKTQDDIDRLQSALTKERNDHKTAKEKLKTWGDLDPNDVIPKLDKLPELEAAAEAAKDPEKLQALVDAKLKTATAPLERDLKKAREEAETLKQSNGELSEKLTTRVKNDAIRQAALEAKVVTTALDDILMIAGAHMELTEDGKVVTKEGAPISAGLDPKAYFQEMAEKRPHWFPPSEGGGSRGGNGGEGFANNPFSAKHWNMTKQAEILNTDRARAERMAVAAGTTIGGPKPAPSSQQ